MMPTLSNGPPVLVTSCRMLPWHARRSPALVGAQDMRLMLYERWCPAKCNTLNLKRGCTHRVCHLPHQQKVIAVCPLAKLSKNGQINKNKNYTSHNHANATFVDAASEAPQKAKTCIRTTAKEIIPPGREIRVDFDTKTVLQPNDRKRDTERTTFTSAEYRKSKTWDTAEARKHATEPEPRGTSTRPGKSAADLRCRQREEVGDGTCPSSLCNSGKI